MGSATFSAVLLQCVVMTCNDDDDWQSENVEDEHDEEDHDKDYGDVLVDDDLDGEDARDSVTTKMIGMTGC